MIQIELQVASHENYNHEETILYRRVDRVVRLGLPPTVPIALAGRILAFVGVGAGAAAAAAAALISLVSLASSSSSPAELCTRRRFDKMDIFYQ